MTGPIDSSFINLDLELLSSEDLTPLEVHFGRRIFLLHCAEGENGFLLVAEPVIAGNLSTDPLLCTDYMLTLVESLPPGLRGLWDRCRVRRFSYGFEGGIEGKSFSAAIDAPRLGRIAAVGAEIEMVMYAYSPSSGVPESAEADQSQRST